jgi:hypothetical protein
MQSPAIDYLSEGKRMKRLLFAGLLFSLLLVPSQAQAQTIIGETITTTYYYPNIGIVYAGPQATLVPSGGTTIFNFAAFTDITFSSNSILITTDRDAGINNVSFDGFFFNDANAIFNTVTLDPSSTYAGFDASRITFDSHNLYVNVENLPGLLGQTILLDINTPEPPTLLLMGTGLFIALAVWRKLFAVNVQVPRN